MKRKRRLAPLQRQTDPDTDTPDTRLLAPQNQIAHQAAHRMASTAGTHLDLMPGEDDLTDQVRDWWAAGRWADLAALSADDVATHPQRAQLAAYQAATLQQLGERSAARRAARSALDWGLSPTALAHTLLAGARYTLGRASLLAGRHHQAQSHLELALSGVRMQSEVRRLAQARRDELDTDLQAAKQAAARQHAVPPPDTRQTPPWIVDLAARCLRADDLHASVDQAVATQLPLAEHRVLLLTAMADHLAARGDRFSGLHFLNQARTHAQAAGPQHVAHLAAKLLALGAPDDAVEVTLDAALSAAPNTQAAPETGKALLQAYQRTRAAAGAAQEHGHEVLLAYLKQHLPALKGKAHPRPLSLIEIGSTREDVPGQGSTRKLAEFCLSQGLHFITVDMDPHNTRMARQVLDRLGAPALEAVNMKGEDFLHNYAQPVDFIFLDAYDFDHGKHSELRQSRYQRFLGGPIDDNACHQMHLSCAESLHTKLWQHGLVCLDDTWLDAGKWTAKGTLAMPYLLSHGFELIEARNCAALLRRTAPPSAATAAGAPN